MACAVRVERQVVLILLRVIVGVPDDRAVSVGCAVEDQAIANKILQIGLIGSDSGTRSLALKVLPFPSPDKPPQSVEIRLNSHLLETLELAPGWNRYEVTAPAAAWEEGANQVSFRFGWLQSPAELDPNSGDPRYLAAAFDSVERIR